MDSVWFLGGFWMDSGWISLSLSPPLSLSVSLSLSIPLSPSLPLCLSAWLLFEVSKEQALWPKTMTCGGVRVRLLVGSLLAFCQLQEHENDVLEEQALRAEVGREVECWVDYGWILGGFWAASGWILGGFWVDPGWILGGS